MATGSRVEGTWNCRPSTWMRAGLSGSARDINQRARCLLPFKPCGSPLSAYSQEGTNGMSVVESIVGYCSIKASALANCVS